MKTKVKRSKREIQILVDRGDDSPDEVLASLNEMADADCWFVIDIRLRDRPEAHEYSGSAMADDFCANITPRCPDERRFYLSKLREYKELEDGTIIWCTFGNMWRGDQSVDGYTPPSALKPPLYMTFQKGLEAIHEIRSFWEAYDGLIKDAAIENPHRQLSESDLRHQWFIKQYHDNKADISP